MAIDHTAKQNGQPAGNAPEQSTPDIGPIEQLIATVRRLLRSTWVATGLGVTLGLLLAILVSAAIVDLIIPLWPSLRFLALVLVVVPSAVAFITGVVRPLLRKLGPTRVARTIEQHIPGIHNRLVSCVDLSTNPTNRVVSPAFHQRLVKEAVERIAKFNPKQVVDMVSLRRAGILAFSGLLAFLVTYGLFSDRLPTALARIFHPFQEIPPATGINYTIIPGNTKVLRGEDVMLAAEVTKGDPKKLRVEIHSADLSQPLWHDLQPNGKRWEFNLSGFEKSFNYRVHGGGTWSLEYHVEMLDRPRIIELHTALHYPKYMAMPEPRIGPPQTGDVTGPEGSMIEVVVQTAGDVATGEIQQLKMQSKQVEVRDRPEKIWFFEQLPEGAQPQGTWEWDFRLLGRNAHTDAAAPGQHGHGFINATAPFPVQSGENLFSYVYLMPDQKPEAIMVQWHDGVNAEHRAYWGEDKIPGGTPATASRRSMGPLPQAGEWVRLEVPAALVELEGKSLKGVTFTLFGGKAVWHRVGTMPPGAVTEHEFVLDKTFAMKKVAADQWSGELPLIGNGFYRVEFQNELKHANKPMKEAKFTSIPDNPPQVVLERPAADITLSEPGKVPLVISAFDDFGLDKLVLSIQQNPSSGFESKPFKRYEKPVRSDNVIHTLDLTQMNLKKGDQIRYRVEAFDKHEQSKSTQEFTIKIQDDANAADKKLATFEKAEDTFQEKLVHLIAEQAKVQDAVEKMTAKYEPLNKKIEAAREQALAKAKAELANAKPVDPKVPPVAPQPAKPLELDPESAKLLEALRQELAQVAQMEEKNSQLGQQIEKDLKATVDQAKTLTMLPPQLVDQLQQLPQRFDQVAVKPLQNLAAQMKDGATPAKEAPNLNEIAKLGDKLQQDLQRMQDKMAALKDVGKQMNADVEKALAQLQRDILEDRAGATERELAELRDFIKNLKDQLQQFEGKQEQLLAATEKAPELLLPDVEKRQEDLEKQADPELAQAKDILKADEMRRKKRKPEFPESPYAAEADEYKIPPAEEDTPETADEKKDAKDADKAGDKDKDKDDKDKDKDMDEEPEPLFMPALGGPKPKLDPRFADKIRPVDKPKDAKKGDQKPQAEKVREELGSRQQQKLQELQTAKDSLETDQQSLSDLLAQLRDAAGMKQPAVPKNAYDSQKAAPKAADQNAKQGNDQADNPPTSDQELAQQLSQLMQSPTMKEAQAMMARMQQMKAQAAAAKNQPPGTPKPANQPPPGAVVASQQANLPVAATEVVLQSLDLETRSVILKMQPRMREELLQGLREEGPDGYQKFIRNYFQKLAKVKSEK